MKSNLLTQKIIHHVGGSYRGKSWDSPSRTISSQEFFQLLNFFAHSTSITCIEGSYCTSTLTMMWMCCSATSSWIFSSTNLKSCRDPRILKKIILESNACLKLIASVKLVIHESEGLIHFSSNNHFIAVYATLVITSPKHVSSLLCRDCWLKVGTSLSL